jgi:hypothetical protein
MTQSENTVNGTSPEESYSVYQTPPYQRELMINVLSSSLHSKPALFTPKLGSTVARPQGLDWNDSGSVKEHDAQSDSPFGDNVLPVLPGTIPHAGMSVAVHVEREVV